MKSIKHLNFFIEVIPLTLNYYHSKEANSIQAFCLGLLQRLFDSACGLKVILPSIPENKNLDYTAGLITRATLLDFLIGLNFLKTLKDGLTDKLDIEELKNKTSHFCETILADGLEQTAKYFELLGSIGIVSSRKVKEAYNNLARKYPSYFQPHLADGSIPICKFKNIPKPVDLFKKLANDGDLKEIAKIYDLYLYYSKYDHFGQLYFEVMQENHEVKMKRLDKAISLFVNHCANLYDTLERVSGKDSFILQQYKFVGNYLLLKNSK